MAESIAEISFGSASSVTIKAITTALKGLNSVLSSISEGVKEAFSIKGYQDYLQAVRRFGKNLADELLVLQLSFGKMKVAIAQAVAPIMEVFVPYLNQAISGVIQFASTVRQFFGALMAGVTGNDALASSAENAADAEKSLASAAKSAGRAARRSLMGFDEINRLNAGSGGSSGSSGSISLGGAADVISPEIQAIVDKILALLAPLMAIDLTPLKTSLEGLWLSVSNLAGLVGSALEWLWYEVLTPFIAWILETLAPAMTDGWAAALDLIAAAIEPVMTGMESLWESLQPIIAFIGETVVLAIRGWQEAMESLTAVIRQNGPQIISIFQNLGQVVTAVWGIISPILTLFQGQAQEVFRSVGAVVSTVASTIIGALSGISQYLAGVFTGDWKSAWEGIKNFLRSIINGVIGLLNSLINSLVSALNAVIRTANKLSFTVPSWVPGIGGSKFGVNMRTVSAPQIPYLAQGAVLPANKPFLAMVGDQRHGTNVEAPLATIQEAVATVLGDQVSAMMAGFHALLEENQRLRLVVENIELGDSTIGQLANRYNRKMAVMRGESL